MIYLDDVSLFYNNEKVLSNFSYLFEDDKIYGITGQITQIRPLLEVLAGISKSKEGKCIYSDSIKTISDLGYVKFGSMLDSNLTLEDNLRLILEMSNCKYDSDKIMETLNLLDIDLILNTKVSQMSNFQRTVAEFIIPYLKGSKAILLDCVDIELQEDYKFVINNLKKLYYDKLCIIAYSNTNDNNFNNEIDLCSTQRRTYEKPVGMHNIKRESALKGLILAFKSFFLNQKRYLLTIGLLFIFILSLFNIVSSNKLYTFSDLTKTMAKSGDLTAIIVDDANIEISNVKYRKKIELENTRIDGFKANGKYNIFKYYVFDDTLQDNELKITSVVAEELISKGILPHKEYKNLVGEEIILSYSRLYDDKGNYELSSSKNYNIKDIIICDEDENITRTLYGNKNTYFDLFKLSTYEKHIDANNVVIFNIINNAGLINYRSELKLSLNELCVGKQALRILKEYGYNPIDGEYLDLEVFPSLETKMEKFTYSFKIKLDDSINDFQISSETQNELTRVSFLKYFGLKNTYYDEYDSYYFDDFNNYKAFKSDLNKTLSIGDKLIYVNEKKINNILNNDLNNSFENILEFSISLVLVVIMSILLISNIKYKYDTYQYLKRIGLSIKGKYILTILPAILTIILTYIFANIIDIIFFLIKGSYVKSKYTINSFIMMYNFPFSLIVLFIIILYASLISVLAIKIASKKEELY